MSTFNIRLEVMNTIEHSMGDLLRQYIKPIEENWQPSDLLPDANDPEFYDQIKEIQALSKEMDYDLNLKPRNGREREKKLIGIRAIECILYILILSFFLFCYFILFLFSFIFFLKLLLFYYFIII